MRSTLEEGSSFYNMSMSLVTLPMHASFLFYHSNLQLAYTTQAWILKFKTCAMQANI